MGRAIKIWKVGGGGEKLWCTDFGSKLRAAAGA